jgi:hypothetical protein
MAPRDFLIAHTIDALPHPNSAENDCVRVEEGLACDETVGTHKVLTVYPLLTYKLVLFMY